MNGKRFIWSKRAIQDRKDILDYWNETNGNKNYRKQLNSDFNDLTELLLFFPLPGRKVDNYDSRFIVKGDYNVFYRIINEQDIFENRKFSSLGQLKRSLEIKTVI